jgi:hypothetical protein
MTQILEVLEALALIALYWGLPTVAVALAVLAWRRSKIRYHVGTTSPLASGVRTQTYRTKAAARKASMELYRQHGVCFRISRTSNR